MLPNVVLKALGEDPFKGGEGAEEALQQFTNKNKEQDKQKMNLIFLLKIIAYIQA